MTVLNKVRLEGTKASGEPSAAGKGISFSVAALLGRRSPAPAAEPLTDDEAPSSADEDVDVEAGDSLPPPHQTPIRPTPFTAFAAAAAAAAAAYLPPPHQAPAWHHFSPAHVFPSFHSPLSTSPGKYHLVYHEKLLFHIWNEIKYS